ncbi:3',5'-cyclic AMP phosphodiesterase CpdA [Caldanaerobius fijiensis DSM 17918]|uniref:3',5'-cyclic AMP phosphodiesterase CpdA n=1 Tax=Caldanaerobius fijiensis DSM 17918 TaxID=1121256 RepID=A0A1M4VC67_9THEO|nr:metallophosphoesterase [Caldanaerobius fijiensis]SHE66448.1 3',5'-cyclic AMP phosphodiesterase CpdA [Caldanaerobius fijiensis DSM 17918]
MLQKSDGQCLVQEQGKTTRLAVLADLHLPQGTERLRRAVAAVEAEKVDAVLVAGDLTQRGEEWEYAEWLRWKKRFAVPVFCVPGNHDVGDKGEVTGERLARYESQVGPSFFAVNVGAVRVIGLNSLLFGSGLEKEVEQWAFLSSELCHPASVPLSSATSVTTLSQYRTDRPRVVFLHHPPFRVQLDEKADYWNIDPESRRRLLDLFEANEDRICGVLAGHLHYPTALAWNNVPILVAPAVSFGLPEGKQPEGWMLVTVTGNAVDFVVREF